MSLIRDIEDFRALEPFFRIIEQGLQGLADGVVAAGYPYSNRYISVITLKDRKVSHWRDYLDPLRVFAALEGR